MFYMIIYLIYSIRLLFLCYMILLLIRVVGSWISRLQNSSFMHFVAHYTDPYLNLFRRFIPPIGGVLDLSPLIGFFVLNLLEKLVLALLLSL